MLVDPAQIDHRLDAALGQLLEAVIAGLAAAKDMIVDAFEIGQTRRCPGRRPATARLLPR